MNIGPVKEVGDRPPEPLVIPRETPEPEFQPRRHAPAKREKERELEPVKR
jgi:hypothetical protein